RAPAGRAACAEELAPCGDDRVLPHRRRSGGAGRGGAVPAERALPHRPLSGGEGELLEWSPGPEPARARQGQAATGVRGAVSLRRSATAARRATNRARSPAVSTMWPSPAMPGIAAVVVAGSCPS